MSNDIPPASSSDDNHYVLDVNDEREMARLVLQSHMLTAQSGGLFPETQHLSEMSTILDLACGAGGWALQVAEAHPHIEVTGVDISLRMVQYGMAQAFVHQLSNVHFHQMNILHPLPFAARLFDLVNARLMFGFMRPQDWPALMQECYRVLCPGGILRLTEAEINISNSDAGERLSRLFTQALARSGQSFSPDGRHIGITPMLGQFLQAAGLRHIRHMAYAIDSSYGASANGSIYSDYLILYKLVRPFLVKMGVASEEELTQLAEEALHDMLQPGYRSIGYSLIVWGEKPEEN